MTDETILRATPAPKRSMDSLSNCSKCGARKLALAPCPDCEPAATAALPTVPVGHKHELALKAIQWGLTFDGGPEHERALRASFALLVHDGATTKTLETETWTTSENIKLALLGAEQLDHDLSPQYAAGIRRLVATLSGVEA